MRTRRLFLRESAVALFGVGATPAWLARAAFSAQTVRKKKVLVAIFQRGAADGLNTVVPFAEKRYYDLRPSIAIPRPGAENGALDLDESFGLHPSLSSLKPLYESGELAIVHAAGSPDPTRSHFDAQDYMESGTPGRKATQDGWMNRALPPEEPGDSPVRAVALGKHLPRALRGPNSAVAVGDLREFEVRGEASEAFRSVYSNSLDAELHGTAEDTFDAVRLLQSIERRQRAPENGARYPSGGLGSSLEQVARMIKADVGIEVAFADVGGWDHHANEPPRLSSLLRQFGDALAAFHRDLGDRMEDVAVVTMSEFGRTAKENGNRGTDHGHANAMFVIGGGVEGGEIYGEWPGLEHEQLYEGRDLEVSTDFRRVLRELVSDHLGAADTGGLFPGFEYSGPVGLLGS